MDDQKTIFTSTSDAAAPTRREAMESIARVATYVAPATLVLVSKVSDAGFVSPP